MLDKNGKINQLSNCTVIVFSYNYISIGNIFVLWTCLSVCRLISWSVCQNFLKRREVSLPYSVSNSVSFYSFQFPPVQLKYYQTLTERSGIYWMNLSVWFSFANPCTRLHVVRRYRGSTALRITVKYTLQNYIPLIVRLERTRAFGLKFKLDILNYAKSIW